jgi:hypothetical protein
MRICSETITDIDIESNNIEDPIDKIQCCVKLSSIMVIILLTLPLLVIDFYYASTDVSCIHKMPNVIHIRITIFTYFMVDGCLIGMVTVLWMSSICLLSLKTITIISKDMYVKMGTIMCITFSLIWTIIGTIVYNNINHYNCKEELTNYLYVNFIVKYAFIIVTIKLCTAT